jgi:hypothetical protein
VLEARAPGTAVLYVWRPAFDSTQRQETLFYSTASRPALGPAHPFPARGLKQPGRNADHSPPSSAEIRSGSAIPSPPLRLRVMVLN